MSVETIDYSWMHEQISAEQYDAMPEELCRNIEIVDGMVHVSPKPTPFHNDVARWIANSIEAAGRPTWRTTTDVDLRLRDIPLLNRQPDVLVYKADTPRNRRIPLEAVLAVVEIVSPGSESTDRVHKPLEYAAAGIRFYWRVEINAGTPVVYTYELDRRTNTYSGTGIFEDTVKANLGFPVEIDLTDV
ncbi:Uma2 family endonuclease [Catenulispora pinisilvae]|uniref:Uma2 family endonuclease n=1 Tax=Catenulispora pinisilvae TaxID=2705253 RepID=UPI0018916E28|nr:Uma2 family endonuclease [Catenulispora pinisilvae]